MLSKLPLDFSPLEAWQAGLTEADGYGKVNLNLNLTLENDLKVEHVDLLWRKTIW